MMARHGTAGERGGSPVARRLANAAGAAAFVVPLAVYVCCLSPWPSNWDTAELQTVPYILGIAHPTGFPAFTLLGWLFSHAVAFDTVAWRMNLFSALCMATSAWLVYALARTLGARPAESLGAALAFAFAQTAWTKAVRIDVHAMSLALMLAALFFAVRCARGRNGADLVRAGVATGFGLATHPVVLWVVPALAVAALASRAWLRARVLLATVAGIVLPLALYAYLPLRSAWVAAHGLDPTAAPPLDGAGSIVWNTNDPRTWSGFLTEVSGSQFGAGGTVFASLDVRRLPHVAQVWSAAALPDLGMIVMVLAALGLAALAMRRSLPALTLVAGTFSVLPFAIAFSDVESDVSRYYLPTFAATAALAACASRLRAPFVPAALRSALVAGALAFAAWHAYDGRHGAAFAERNDTGGAETIAAIQRDVPDGAIVVSGWVDASSLAYAAFVDRSLGSRTIVSGWPGEFADRYPAWAAQRSVFLFLDGNAVRNLPTVRKDWLTALPSSAGGHQLYRVRPVGKAAAPPRTARR